MKSWIWALLGITLLGSPAAAGALAPALRALVRQGVPKAEWGRIPPSPFAPRIDRSGRVQVVIRPLRPGGALPPVSSLEALGAVKVRFSRLMDEIQAWVPVDSLRSVAALPGVGRVGVPTYAVVEPPPGNSAERVRPSAVTMGTTPPTGLPIDQTAIEAMQAAELQAIGAEGQGIKVGVISDDDSGNAASQQAGYLPTTIWSDPNYPGTSPTPGDPAEGTAMLEEVHAMVPEAQLGFCGPATSSDFVTCYQDFVNWGARVIVDDLGFNADMFTRGVKTPGSFANAIYTVVSQNPNVAFLSAAGNDAKDYLQAPYTPISCPSAISATSCMYFGAVTNVSGTALSKYNVSNVLPVVLFSSTFDPVLEWNDPLSTANPPSFTTNYTLYLFDTSGNLLATGTPATTNDGRPVSYFNYNVPSSTSPPVLVGLVVACTAGCSVVPTPTLKLLGNGDGAVLFGLSSPSEPMYTAGSTSAGQTAVPGVLATVAGAVDQKSPLEVTLEGYSALGPYLYGDIGATAIESEPALTGIDDVETSGAGGFSSSGTLQNGGVAFCGTSATGPNVGALVAALMSADPGQSASFYAQALASTASKTAIAANVPIPSSNPTDGYQCSNGNLQGYVDTSTENDAGVGLAQGYAALTSFFKFETTTISAPPDVTVSSGGTATEDVPLNVPVTYTATVSAGTNSASTTACNWPGTQTSGPSATYTFPAAGSYVVEADCEDSQGILNPSYATIDVTAENIPAPTVALATTSQPNVFDLTLTGTEPLTLSVASSDPAFLPASGISLSSGCGTTTLTCTITLSPVPDTSGSSELTLTATDPYGQKGEGRASFSYTYTPPSSGGGGGALGPWSLLVLGALSWLVVRRRRA
jgi:hypothetical protein